MAAITLWMGIGSVFITGRTAAASQSVIEQMTRLPRAYDARTPRNATPEVGQQTSGSASAAPKQNSLERLGTR
jgi:hypothetical protein